MTKNIIQKQKPDTNFAMVNRGINELWNRDKAADARAPYRHHRESYFPREERTDMDIKRITDPKQTNNFALNKLDFITP